MKRPGWVHLRLETMSTTVTGSKGGAAGSDGARQKDAQVWVLPMARILEIVRGTPVDVPGGARATGEAR